MIGIFPYKSEVELKKPPWETIKFMLACALVHIITWRIGCRSLDSLIQWYHEVGFSYDLPYTALTHIFIHGDFGHIFFNMLFLFIFSAPIEQEEGKKKFWLMVLISALFSSYFSVFVSWVFDIWTSSPDSFIESLKKFQVHRISIGASGVVASFAAAYLIRFWRKKLFVVINIMGVPIPKLFPISAWVLVGAYLLTQDLVIGVLFQGMLPLSGTNHFAHLGGYIAGFSLAYFWGFHKHHKRDYFIELGEDFAKFSMTGRRAAYESYLQAQKIAPGNSAVLLELARASHNLSQFETSREYYRKAIIEIQKSQNTPELAKAYAEAFERTGLIFLSEKQLEFARILLAFGNWKVAIKSLESFCQALKSEGSNISLYIRAKLIIAYILDHHYQKMVEARKTIICLLHEFPEHPLLKYPEERLRLAGENAELFNFNYLHNGYPFTILRSRIKPLTG